MPKSKPPRKKHRGKSRDHETTVRFEAVANADGEVVVHTSPDGLISSPQAIQRSYRTVTEYMRDSGKPKIVFAHSSKNDGAYLSEYRSISPFSKIAGMDTNTIYIGDLRVSTTALLISTSNLAEGDVRFRWHGFAMMNIPEETNPELVALDIAFHHFLPDVRDGISGKLGIVLDSALGDHDLINKRMTPYLGEKLLRENVEIIYASGESGNGFTNKLIKLCDSKANDLKRQCIDTPEILIPVKNSYPFCDGWMMFSFQGE